MAGRGIRQARHRIAAANELFDGHLVAYDRRVARMDAEIRRLGEGDRLAGAFYTGLRGPMEENRRRMGEVYGKRKEALRAAETVLVFMLERQGRYSIEEDTVVFQSADDKAYFAEWMAVVRAREAEAQKLYDESLTILRRIGTNYQVATAITNVGARLQNAGDLQGAQRRYREALSLFQGLFSRCSHAVPFHAEDPPRSQHHESSSPSIPSRLDVMRPYVGPGDHDHIQDQAHKEHGRHLLR